jgi:hypothetical protein
MAAYHRLANAHPDVFDSATRSINSLTRSLLSLEEALKRHRSGGEQRVTVRHVSISDGGQAIVGNVSHTTAKQALSDDRKQTAAITHTQQAPIEIISQRERELIGDKDEAATARGIPGTNVPDTFIEEVADHPMTLLLATFRRLVEQDRMVREVPLAGGSSSIAEDSRLMGQTLGFIAFGHVARAVARRARAFGLRMLPYDPFVEELIMSEYLDRLMPE